MLVVHLLFQLFEWHACEHSGLSQGSSEEAKRADHYNYQFRILFFLKKFKKWPGAVIG